MAWARRGAGARRQLSAAAQCRPAGIARGGRSRDLSEVGPAARPSGQSVLGGGPRRIAAAVLALCDVTGQYSESVIRALQLSQS